MADVIYKLYAFRNNETRCQKCLNHEFLMTVDLPIIMPNGEKRIRTYVTTDSSTHINPIQFLHYYTEGKSNPPSCMKAYALIKEKTIQCV